MKPSVWVVKAVRGSSLPIDFYWAQPGDEGWWTLRRSEARRFSIRSLAKVYAGALSARVYRIGPKRGGR